MSKRVFPASTLTKHQKWDAFPIQQLSFLSVLLWFWVKLHSIFWCFSFLSVWRACHSCFNISPKLWLFSFLCDSQDFDFVFPDDATCLYLVRLSGLSFPSSMFPKYASCNGMTLMWLWIRFDFSTCNLFSGNERRRRHHHTMKLSNPNSI